MGDCDSLESDVARLLGLIETLQEAVGQVSPQDKILLLAALNKARNQLTARRHDLEECRSGQARLMDPRVMGFEVNQGLPGYDLVAGKDTLVRVFLAVRPDVLAPAAVAAGGPIITNEPVFHQATLDYASLAVTRPDGATFEVPGDLGDGVFTNFSRLFGEEHNANFYLPGGLLAVAGVYSATARFYREGSSVGTVDLGSHRFHPTKDLRLLIVVDTWPMPVGAWNTLFRALEHVQRAFPIRAGVGPLNSDRRRGLRYQVDPEPFDPDFPGWEPVRQRLAQFNDTQQAQGHPDRAEHIMTVRVQQPDEPPRGGVGAQGPGASVSGVTLNVDPPADGVFATLISQEIGHNFGLRHTPEAEIADPSAFDLLGRRSIQRPRSIMFAFYADTPSEDGLFLPSDWSTIRQGLVASASTGTG